MGGCFSTSHDGTSGRGENADGTVGSMPIGRNQPLKPEKPKWKSDVPLTTGQLQSKRDEFWETAPAYEGRKEIWDALRGAASALESGDFVLSQAIIDGANISCPNGALTDCYDELGNRYTLPVYTLSAPVNMVEETSDIDVIDPEPPAEGGTELTVKFRLSSGKELKLNVRSTDTIYQVKKRIHGMENVEPSRQRFFFSGKLLTDKTRVEEARLAKGFVVQVILSQPNPAPVDG
ncbi:ubiquitin domain-containing protein 2-like [Lytechinus pictus]|uniref:ubiquitin domain-containing protein 2-like n=1 Tax=Lytechinus pictus TaxID=7653 RepID=UPI00240E6C10|nr:ubiquitin domain-containing protein 2-like [Lytechinus pictus]